MYVISSEYSGLESDIATVNADLSRKYLTYASYDRLINLYEFYIKKYENLTGNYYSFELAKLYRQAAYLIINTGDLEKFAVAESYLENAINIIENLYYTSKEFVDLYSGIYYLYSIIFEHRGDVTKAYNICMDILRNIAKKKLTSIAPDTIKRQVYLLTKDADLIIDINNTSNTTDLFELFQNKRRLFQWYLLCHDTKRADNTQKELTAIVQLLGRKLDKIYIGMYYKDMAKYHYYKKESALSKSFFRRALALFNTYRFEGQKKMLLLDNELYKYRMTEFKERDHLYV